MNNWCGLISKERIVVEWISASRIMNGDWLGEWTKKTED